MTSGGAWFAVPASASAGIGWFLFGFRFGLWFLFVIVFLAGLFLLKKHGADLAHVVNGGKPHLNDFEHIGIVEVFVFVGKSALFFIPGDHAGD